MAAAPVLMRRADWDKVLRWCEALGEPALARRHDLRGVQVRCLLMSRRQDDLEELVRRMRATGEFDRLRAEAPDVAAWAAWGLHVSGDWAGMLALIGLVLAVILIPGLNPIQPTAGAAATAATELPQPTRPPPADEAG